MIVSLRNKLSKIPRVMLLFITLIACTGFAILYSAAQGNLFPWAFKQMIYFVAFFPIMIAIALTDIRFWYKSAYFFYFITLILLILVHLLGYTAMGATRWINLGVIKLQPSELMKICIIFALARYFNDMKYQKISFINLIKPLIILFIPVVLIIKQPDLGTGLILLMLGGILFFIAGASKWLFVIAAVKIAIIIPIAWKLMYSYQRSRVTSFLNPEQDPLGSGYNIIQSKIAIGSGGFSGKGFIKGSQSQLQFLPEHQTDFIFTMFSEEWGFIGGILLLISYFVIIAYCYLIAFNARTIFARLISMGIAIMFFLHIFVNIAMVTGIIPVVGVPLPLLSYGGTMMATILMGFGLVMSSHIHNHKRHIL